MTTYDKCPTCKEYDWLPHKCKPEWAVAMDYGDRADDFDYDIQYDKLPTMYRADNAENAAIKYAESDFEHPDSMDVYVISKKAWLEIVDVEKADGKNKDEIYEIILKNCKKFHISSEVVRNFYAEEVESTEESELK